MKWGCGTRWVAVFLIVLSTLGCDQATKQMARAGLGSGDSTSTAGGLLEFTLAENPGAFLSLGALLPASLRVGVFTVGTGMGLIVLLVYLIRSPRLTRLTLVGFALILGGGAGNLLDRLTREGLVTDFMILRVGPLHTGVFNVADMAVMAGVGVLLYYTFKPEPKGLAPAANK
jgi:signal peptidase II